ncbi:MAG: hypothetical protein AABZ74_15735 [Cyanobacteriota bacterium]
MKKITVPGILVLYHRHLLGKDAATVNENIEAFEKHSKFPVWKVNTEIVPSKDLEKLEFNVIIFHYSIFAEKYHLSDEYINFIQQSQNSHKIAFFQDEYRFCKQRFKFMNDFNIDTVYTCVEPEYYHLVYGKYTNVKHIKTCFPGYVSKELPEIGKNFFVPDEKRNLDIGYRGRQLDFFMGKGAQEKHVIGWDFKKLCENNNLNLNIDVDSEENSRLYGDKWYKFMANCKGVLGVESGVSIFDIEDKVIKACDIFLKSKPNATFEETFDSILFEWENNIPLRTVSPRHFEASAFRNCQILFEGNYSGVLKPYEHYIPLKKDYSNFDEVIKIFTNEKERNEITSRAYRDIIESGNYTYKKFIEGFDEHLSNVGVKKEDFNKDKIDKIINRGLSIRKAQKLSSTVAMSYARRTFWFIMKDEDKRKALKNNIKKIFRTIKNNR